MNFLSALIGPFFLLLLEKVLPYPYLVEELYKFFLAKSTNSTKAAIVLGVLFSLSEAVFYLMNPSYIFNLKAYGIRLIAVAPMHITTILSMQYFVKKNLWPIGLITAILIHYLFNQIGVAGSDTAISLN